jgi:hypothetical protein
MFSIRHQYGHKELLWNCTRCGRKKVLSMNTGGKMIIAHFDPPLKIQCCGNSESYQFIEANISANNTVRIDVIPLNNGLPGEFCTESP